MKRSKTLRSAIARERASSDPKAPRYSAEVRKAVVTLAASRRASGVSLLEVAAEVDLPVNTVRRWLDARSAAPLARVQVTEETAGGPILVTPSGHRVEGLSVAALADLLGRLS